MLVVPRTHDVLRFEIAVGDPKFMAGLQSVDELNKHILDSLVVTLKNTLFNDGAEQITARAIVHNHEDVVFFSDYMMQPNDVWMFDCLV